MIGGGWADSLTSLAPSWGYDGKGTDSHRFFSTQTDYEGNYNASQKRFKALNMSKLPNKTSNHTALMGMECCTENAIVKCAMGTIFSRLHVIDPSRLGFIGKDGPRNRFATVMDFVPGVNFDGFGACWNLLNPVCLANTIAASIAAGMFVLTPAPCMLTMMPSPWPLVQPPVLYKGVPLLVNTNISICWGLGFIQVVNCGQGQGPGAPGFSDGNGNLDWHAIAATAANVAGALALPFAIGSKIALATNAAKAAQIGAGLKNAAIAANVLSAGITVADGVGYLYQGKYLEAGLSIGLGSLGVKSGVSELGQGARVVNGIKEAAKAGKIPAEVLQKLNGVKGIANNPVAIRKIIQQNPETFGKISKMPTKELDKLIKSSGFSDSVAAFGRKEEALQRITTNTEKLKTMPDPNATITKLQTAQEDLHTAQKILPEVEDTLRQSKAAKEALPEAKLALEESQNAKKALPAAQEALNKATQAEKELPGLERQLANAKAAEGQIENAKTAVGIAKDAAEKLPGEEAALKAMKQDLASLEKELDEMSKSADSLEDLSQIDGVAEKYQEIARLRQAITEKTTHVENLKNTANLLEDAEANLKRVEEEAGKIKEIESQIDNIKAGKKAAEEKFKELSGLAANEDKYQNEVNRLTDLAAKEKGAQAMVDELNDQISNKQHEIAELTGQFHDYNKTSNQITIDNMTVKNDHLKSQTHHEEHYVYTGIDGEEYWIPTDNFPAEIGDGLLKTGAFETGMTGSSMYDWSQENNDGKVKDRNRDLEITPEDLNKYNSDFEEELKQNGLIKPDMDFSKYDFSLLDD
ncbi:MAG: DUF4280 domain-containing protein [Bacteroidales bacterium]|nr:DUF4280 domain-containing protein [Bacteroidales bacterium]